MKKFIVRLLAVIGALTILAVIIGLGILAVSILVRPSVPGKTILEVNLETDLVEYVPEDPVAQAVALQTPAVEDIVDALEKDGDDSRVTALVARIGAAPRGTAQVQEIRDAVRRFRSKNKFAVAFSETFGEVGTGGGAYYL